MTSQPPPAATVMRLVDAENELLGFVSSSHDLLHLQSYNISFKIHQRMRLQCLAVQQAYRAYTWNKEKK